MKKDKRPNTKELHIRALKAKNLKLLKRIAELEADKDELENKMKLLKEQSGGDIILQISPSRPQTKKAVNKLKGNET